MNNRRCNQEKNLSNNYLSIGRRSLIRNKKRSFLIILGIVLSVALITAIGTFFYSIKHKKINEYRLDADYHLVYSNLSKNEKNIIENFATIERFGYYDLFGEGRVENTPVRFINTDKKALNLLGYELKGRLPEGEDEIVIYKHERAKYGVSSEIGNVINIKLGINESNKKPMKIVGIATSKGHNENIAIIKDQGLNTGKIEEVAVKLKEDKDLRKHIDDLNLKIVGGNHGKTKVNERDGFLTLLGAGQYEMVNNRYITVVLILSLVVVTATVVMIFNAFNISITERMKEYGLLKAVGATPSQIKHLVLYEAGMLGILGIPIGIFIGCFGLKLFMKIFGGFFMQGIGDIEILFSIEVVILGLVLGIVTIFISSLLPTIKAGKISPLECMNDSIVKISKVPRGRIWSKILKIEGLIAFRNRKINKKRYYITILAMTISIGLFIIMSATLRSALGGFEEYTERSLKGEINVISETEMNKENTENIIEQGEKLKSTHSMIKEVINGYDFGGLLIYSKRESFDGSSKDHVYDNEINIDNEKYKLAEALIRPIDKTHEEYLKKSIEGFSYEDLVEANGVIVMNESKEFSVSEEKYKKINLMNVEKGDVIYLTPYENTFVSYDNSEESFNEVSKKKYGYKVSYTLSKNEVMHKPVIMVPIENMVFKECIGKTFEEGKDNGKEKIRDLGYIRYLGIEFILGYNNKDLEALRKDLNEKFKDTATIVDFIAEKEEEDKLQLTVKVFVYCFIGIVSLISALNIINTVSTNIILRKRELSSLRAIGTSYKSMRNMLLIEGAMYGLYSAIFGSILGIGISSFLCKIVFDVVEGTYRLPVLELIIAFIGAITLGMVSILIPLRKIKNISIIDGIRTLD